MTTASPRAIVIGGGPAGLSAACLLAKAGTATTLITGPAPAARPHDPRTVALMQSSIRLLETIGVWPDPLREIANPLRTLRLIDDTGSLVSAPTVTFTAQEIGADAFGWNIPVEALQGALAATAGSLGVSSIAASARSLALADRTIKVRLDDGATLAADIAIAADGRNSVARRTIGISSIDWSYDQTAIATSFCHSQPHADMSREYHRPDGPLTTVPMPGDRSSLVWMERPDTADALMALCDTAFARRLQLETHGDLGAISDIGPRRAFAMSGLTASRFADQRVVLVGEAAHVVPPIGAQGLNMSLRDAAMIAELIDDARGWGEDVGGEKVMDAYDQRRRADILPRQAVIHSMNSSLLSGIAGLHTLRAAGIALIDRFTPLRQRVMREGLAPSRYLPRAMRA